MYVCMNRFGCCGHTPCMYVCTVEPRMYGCADCWVHTSGRNRNPGRVNDSSGRTGNFQSINTIHGGSNFWFEREVLTPSFASEAWTHTWRSGARAVEANGLGACPRRSAPMHRIGLFEGRGTAAKVFSLLDAVVAADAVSRGSLRPPARTALGSTTLQLHREPSRCFL